MAITQYPFVAFPRSIAEQDPAKETGKKGFVQSYHEAVQGAGAEIVSLDFLNETTEEELASGINNWCIVSKSRAAMAIKDGWEIPIFAYSHQNGIQSGMATEITRKNDEKRTVEGLGAGLEMWTNFYFPGLSSSQLEIVSGFVGGMVQGMYSREVRHSVRNGAENSVYELDPWDLIAFINSVKSSGKPLGASELTVVDLLKQFGFMPIDEKIEVLTAGVKGSPNTSVRMILLPNSENAGVSNLLLRYFTSKPLDNFVGPEYAYVAEWSRFTVDMGVSIGLMARIRVIAKVVSGLKALLVSANGILISQTDPTVGKLIRMSRQEDLNHGMGLYTYN